MSDPMFATLSALYHAEGIIHAGTSAGEIEAAGGSRNCLSSAVKKGWAAKYQPERNTPGRDFRTVYYYRTAEGTEVLGDEREARGLPRGSEAEALAPVEAETEVPAEPEPASEPDGALTAEQTAEIAAAVIMKAADVVEDWSAVQAVIPVLRDVSVTDAGNLIAGWLSTLPGQFWDDRLPLLGSPRE